VKGNKPASAAFVEVCQGKNYVDIYQTAIDKYDYNVLLADYSVLQFDFRLDRPRLSIRYAYLESPYDFSTYEEYLQEAGLFYAQAGEILREQYEEDLSQSPLRPSFTPIRYEYDEDEYIERVHPASHMHIGHCNEVRLPIGRFVTPKLFLLFVLRHIYHVKWKKLVDDGTEAALAAHQTGKRSCIDVDRRCFSEIDKLDLYLT
jgi:hypothetical protein